MLGANLFALAALDAVRRPPAGGRMYRFIVIIGIPVVVEPFAVHNGEQIGNCNFFWASSHAVPAGGAWDQVHLVENLLDFFDSC